MHTTFSHPDLSFSLFLHRGQNYWMLIGRNRGHFFLNFPFTDGKITHSWLVERRKYFLLIGWVRHFYVVLVSSFRRDNNDFFQVLWNLTFWAGLFVPKILGNQVLQLQRKYLEVNFRFLQENCKRLFVSKLKTWADLFGWKTVIIYGGDQVLSPRYGFLQRTITEQ